MVTIPPGTPLMPHMGAFLKTPTLTGTATINEWIAFFEQVSMGKQPIPPKAWVALAIGVLGMAGALLLEQIVLAVIVLIVGLVAFFIMKSASRPIGPIVANTLLPFLRVLQQDLNPAAPLEMAVDMRPANEGRLLSTMPGRDLPRLKEKVEFYEHPWLSLRGRLIDGSHLDYHAVIHMRRRKIRKTNPRGKIKLKTKDRTTSRVRALLRPGKQVTIRRTLPQGLSYDPVKGRLQVRTKTITAHPWPNPVELISPLTSLFQGVNVKE